MADKKTDFNRNELVPINISRRIWPRSFRYRGKRVYEIEDTYFGHVEFFETWDPLKVPKDTHDRLHVVTPKDEYRIDLIAEEHYDNWLLWWVIAAANDVFDPIRDLTIGTVLRIPSLMRVFSEVE